MKKSQIAAALALTYVAGTASPLANMYASAAEGACRPSLTGDNMKVVTGYEIDGLLGEIRGKELFQDYATLVTYKTTTYANAAALDAKLSEATTGATANITAKENAVKGIDKGVLVTNIKKFIPGFVATGSNDIDAIMTELAANEGYRAYVELGDLITANNKTVAELKAAAIKVNEKTGQSIYGIDTIFTNVAFETDRTTVQNALKAGLDYNNATTVRTEEKKYDELVAAQQAQAAAIAAKPGAEQAVKDAIANIKAAIEKVGGTFTAGTDDKNAAAALAAIDNNVTNFDKWETFVTTINGKKGEYANAALNDATLTAIADALNVAEIKAEDVFANADLLPQAQANVYYCSTHADVTVTGKLPLFRTTVLVDKLDNATDVTGVKGAIKQFYNITLNHNGANYATDGSEYKVTIKTPANFNLDTAEVWFVDASNAAKEKMSITEKNASTITFTTNHFSKFILVGDEVANDKVDDQDPADKPVETPLNPVNKDKLKPGTSNVAPNTGVVAAKVAANARANSSATVALMAGIASALAAAVAAACRFAKRRG